MENIETIPLSPEAQLSERYEKLQMELVALDEKRSEILAEMNEIEPKLQIDNVE